MNLIDDNKLKDELIKNNIIKKKTNTPSNILKSLYYNVMNDDITITR